MTGDACFICGEDNPVVLEEHHLVPDRFDGPDSEKNLYTLCANCHTAIEKMYDGWFWEKVPGHIDDTEFIDPDRIDKEYVSRILAIVYSGLTLSSVMEQTAVATNKLKNDLDLQNEAFYSMRPETRREAALYHLGAAAAYSHAVNEIQETAEKIPPRCIGCSEPVDLDTVHTTTTPDGDTLWEQISFFCSNCGNF